MGKGWSRKRQDIAGHPPGQGARSLASVSQVVRGDGQGDSLGAEMIRSFLANALCATAHAVCAVILTLHDVQRPAACGYTAGKLALGVVPEAPHVPRYLSRHAASVRWTLPRETVSARSAQSPLYSILRPLAKRSRCLASELSHVLDISSIDERFCTDGGLRVDNAGSERFTADTGVQKGLKIMSVRTCAG